MLIIYIKDLVIEAKHGFHEHEKNTAQRFGVSVEITIDNQKAMLSDDLADTVNWSLIRDHIVKTVQNNSFNLVERLAQEVADAILGLDQRIQKVIVRIDKLDAFKTGVPGVRIEANRS